MNENFIFNIIASFFLFGLGLMFLEGIWQKKGTIIKSSLNVDNILFPKIKNKRILQAGNKLAFLVCVIMSLLTLINGLFFLVYDNIPNISAIFIFIGVVLSWPLRIIYIYIKKSNYEDTER